MMGPRPSLVTQAEMRPAVIVVVGMHRSGTSLLAQVLGRLGIELGSNLLVQTASDNKYGYWEQAEIAKTQDFLLAELGRMWHEPRGLLPLPDDWLDSPPVLAATEHLSTIVKDEMAAADGASWGFKDPRTARLMPMWQRIFERSAVTPIYIMAVRRPDSVARSLMKRNAMSEENARFLWAQHNLDFFRLSKPSLAAVIDYDVWFSRPARNMQLLLRAIRSPLALPVAMDLCDSVFDRGERHHEAVAKGDASVADRIYKLLLDPMPEAFRIYRMKQLLRQFDDAYALLGAWQETIETYNPQTGLPRAHWQKYAAKETAEVPGQLAGED